MCCESCVGGIEPLNFFTWSYDTLQKSKVFCAIKIQLFHLIHFSFYEYHDFKELDKWELLHSSIDVGEKIGEGAFGAVYIANVKVTSIKSPYLDHYPTLLLGSGAITCAVKMLKGEYHCLCITI